MPETSQPSLPIVEELNSVDVMKAIRSLAGWPRLLLLDSSLKRDPVGRYSFLMADPVKHWELAAPVYGIDPFHSIRSEWERSPAELKSELPPFQGGIAGLLGYELGQCWERIPCAARDEFGLPVLAVGLYDWVIAWDHFANRRWIISQGWPETEPARRRDLAAKRIREVKEALNAKPQSSTRTSNVCSTNNVRFQAQQFPLAESSKVTSTFTKADYLRTVERVIEYIRAGDIFQANLSQRLLA